MPGDPTPPVDLRGLLNDIGRYDPVHLATVAGYLQLDPRNATAEPRLLILAHAAAATRVTGNAPPIQRGKLSSVLNDAPLRDVMWWEDPPEQSFTEVIPFHNGSYLVRQPPLIPSASYVSKMLPPILFLSNFPAPEDVIERWRAELLVLLILSDTQIMRAGLPRYATPVNNHWRNAYVSSQGELTRERMADFAFSWEEIEGLLAGFDVPNDLLEPFVLRLGEVPFSETAYSGDISPFHARPFVRHEDTLVLAAPSMIMTAFRHHVLTDSKRLGLLGGLRERFHEILVANVNQYMGWMRFDKLGSRRLLVDGHDISVMHYSIDADKRTDVVVWTDPLTKYGEENPFQPWEEPTLDKTVWEIFHEIERTHGPSRLKILVTQGLGRNAPSARPTAEPFLHLNATDLEALAWIEAGDPLALYAFAQELARTHGKPAQWFTIGLLNLYGFYRARGSTLEKRPGERTEQTRIWQLHSGPIRHRMLSRIDRHAALAPDAAGHVQVIRLNRDSDLPLYVHSEDEFPRRVLLELGPTSIWFQGEEPQDEIHKQLSSRFIIGIGRLLADLSDDLLPLALRAPARERRSVRLRIEEPANWLQQPRVSAWPDVGSTYKVVREGSTAIVNIRPAFALVNFPPQFEGERALALSLIRSLFEPSESEIEVLSARLNDREAGHIAFYSVTTNPTAVPTGLRFREIPTYAIAAAQRIALEAGQRVPEVTRYEVETGALLARQMQILSEYRTTDVIIELIGRYETFLSERAGFQLGSPLSAQLDPARWQADFIKRTTGESQTSLAIRACIELAAQHPGGPLEITRGMLDELLALAVARLQLRADLEVEKNRLDEIVDSFRPVQREFSRKSIPQALVHAKSKHIRPSLEEPREPSVEPDLEVAMLAEYGCTMVERARALSHVIVYVMHKGEPISRSSRADLHAAIARDTGWSEDKVARVLECLTLRVTPQAAAANYWRYGREQSYFRRPLIEREIEGVPTYFWGFRHAAQSAQDFEEFVRSGRFGQAKSDEMRSFQGRIRRRLGRELEDEAETAMRGLGADVRPRFRRHRDVAMPADMGDIDLIVVEERRRRLLLLQCKSLAMSRSPREWSEEIEELQGAWALLQRQVKWCEEHLSQIGLRIEEPARWTIKPLILVAQRTIASEIARRTCDVVTLDELMLLVASQKKPR